MDTQWAPLRLKKWRMFNAVMLWGVLAGIWMLLTCVWLWMYTQGQWTASAQDSNARTLQVPIFRGSDKEDVSFAGYGLYIGNKKVSTQNTGGLDYWMVWQVNEQGWSSPKKRQDTEKSTEKGEKIGVELWFWDQKESSENRSSLPVHVLIPKEQPWQWDNERLYWIGDQVPDTKKVRALFNVRFIDGKPLPYDGLVPKCDPIAMCVLEFKADTMNTPWVLEHILLILKRVLFFGGIGLIVWYFLYPVFLKTLGVWHILRKSNRPDLFVE